MKHISKFLLLLILCNGRCAGLLYAQNEGRAAIDSMLKELSNAKEDTVKVKLLNDLSYEYSDFNPDEGLKYAQHALTLATQLAWQKGIGNANMFVGMNYMYKSDYPKALANDLTAMKIFEAIGDKKDGAFVSKAIGKVYTNLGDFPKAFDYFFIALKIYEETGDKRSVAKTTGNIGTVYAIQGDFDKALEYFQNALKINVEIGDKSLIAETTGNIGGVYAQMKNYTMAIEYFLKGLKVDYETGDKHSLAGSLGNIGSTYISIAHDTAVQLQNRRNNSELLYRKYKDSEAIPASRAALLREGIDYLRRSLAVCKEINDLEFMKNAYANLIEAYKLNGDYKKALDAADNFTAIKDSIFSKENDVKIVKLGMSNEYERKHLADSLKNAEKEKIAHLELKRQRSFTIMGVAGILFLAVFSFFIIRERRKSEEERKKSDDLLLNILPGEVANELKANGATRAKHYDNVTVLFTDFVNFTNAAERMSPQALIDELHACFKTFDEIAGKYNIEKIKTIGDAYLAVAGLPVADPKHAEKAVQAAVEINAFMEDRLAKLGNGTFSVRIGIHSGSVVAGIVGVKKFAYDIWGDSVNTAARMEQNSVAGKINISQTTYELVKNKFICEYRGEIAAKNKGAMKMYFVNR